MPNAEDFFSNKSLTSFVDKLDINSEQKEKVKKRIPEMGLEARKNLFMALTNVYFLELEEKEALEWMEEVWE